MNRCCGMEPMQSRDVLLTINRRCACMALDSDVMAERMTEDSGVKNLRQVLAERPVLFAHTPVFVSAGDVEVMLTGISAIESVMNTANYRTHIAERNGFDLATQQGQTRGILMAYDFHVGADGPALIEINTNAGGAFIAHQMERALGVYRVFGNDTTLGTVEQQARFLVDMIHQEWRLAGRSAVPKTLVIVDESPADQFLYPDMLLARQLLSDSGITTLIVDASQLRYDGHRLSFDGQPIDFVYNRLTDFQLTDRAHIALRKASIDDAAVISPAPAHHALYADKRNLTLLTDVELLRSWGTSDEHLAALAVVPESYVLDNSNAAQLWTNRKNYFFKPFSGYGSKAVYRGDKLTRRVWERITSEHYIAQEMVRPELRSVTPDSPDGSIVVEQKYDVRVFTYAGHTRLMVARLYQGQTTNFRTPGGGFAPVVLIGTQALHCLTDGMASTGVM